MSNVAIRVTGIGKTYAIKNNDFADESQRQQSHINALDDISFDVLEGDSIALIGSNGSGKSTLLGILSGLIKPNSGTIKITGRVASILDIGSNFIPDLSGRENAELFLRLNSFSKRDAPSLIENIKDFSSLGQYFEQPLKSYSKGMFLRLAFSSAFFQDADIYILDEVLSVGDESFRLKIKLVIEEFKKNNKTLIFATHDRQEVLAIGSKCIWIESGKIRKLDKPQSVIPEYSKFQRIKFEREVKKSDYKDAGIIEPKLNECGIELMYKESEFGNENVDVLGIEVRGNSGIKTILKEEGIKIKIRINKKMAGYSLSCQIKIRNEFEHPVLFVMSLNNSSQLNLDSPYTDYSGIIDFLCVVPERMLSSGQYFMSIWIGKNINPEQPLYNERAYYFPHEVSFKLDTNEQEFISEPIHYSIQPALEWNVTAS